MCNLTWQNINIRWTCRRRDMWLASQIFNKCQFFLSMLIGMNAHFYNSIYVWWQQIMLDNIPCFRSSLQISGIPFAYRNVGDIFDSHTCETKTALICSERSAAMGEKSRLNGKYSWRKSSPACFFQQFIAPSFRDRFSFSIYSSVLCNFLFLHASFLP